MPIHEQSFRIGCGRYIQGENIIYACGSEAARLGQNPLVIGGASALSLTRNAIAESLSKTCNNHEFLVYSGTCCDEHAEEIAASCAQKQHDVIIGVGGGVMMDFAKLCGYFAKCPVINIPTSSATCAAYTPLSVRYTPDGKTVGSLHYGYEVNAVLADTAILVKQPVRLLLAGVFDAMAKFVEIKQRFHENTSEYPLGLDYAYTLSKKTYRFFSENIDGCIEDMKKNEITPRLENVIFASIAATGVISGISRGSNQCALAHKFYETTRFLFHKTAKPFLHGEIVGVGLLLQNHFNHEEANNADLSTLMKKYKMPYKITNIGIDRTKETMNEYYKRLAASSAVDQNNPDECARLKNALTYLWEVV